MADRVPPHDLEAEIAVLGSMLLDPEAAGRVVSILKPDSFYRGPHAEVFQVLTEIYDANRAIDVVLLREELQRRGILEKVGGTGFISRIVASVPTAANAEHYAKIVKECGTRRAVIQAANDIEAEAYDGGRAGGELIDYAESRYFDLDRRSESGEALHIKDVLNETFQRIDAMQGSQGRITGVPTGFYDMDDMTSGLQPGELIVVAGRPSMGKTTFCLNVAEHAAVAEGRGVAIFSLEMSKHTLVQNMLCSRARVDAHRLRRGFLADEDWGRLSQAVGKLSEAPIMIDDTPGLSPLLLRAKARRMKAKQDISMIIIDYLQLMEVPQMSSRGDPNRQAEISYISRSLKGLARELSIPIIALSQLNRSVDSREDHRPRMSDLRECVTGDTLVCLTDGRRAPIRDLVGTTPSVWAVDSRGRLIRARSDKVWRVGAREVFEVCLASGRRIRATGRHRFLTRAGWRRVDAISPGELFASAQPLPALPDGEALHEPRRGASTPAQGEALGYGAPQGRALKGRFNELATEPPFQGSPSVGIGHPGLRPGLVLSRPCGAVRLATRSPSSESGVQVAERAGVSSELGIALGTDLQDLATRGLEWDEVLDILPCGRDEVFDMTVPGPACWLADGIVTHNSGAIEQDADVIMFLYRPEYYETDPDKKAELAGQAECIVGKQRNGPTGTVNLTFLAQFMRFESAAREQY